MSRFGSAALMLKEALALHQKGRLAGAAARYRKILSQDPRNADVLDLLDVIETQRKNSLAAIELFDRAIELSPQNEASTVSTKRWPAMIVRSR